jgi:hypothetical protein
VIDTVQWEGFRAGVDDMRYLATLLDVIELAKAQNKDTSAAEAWLTALKSSSLANLDAIRATMISFILELQ